MLHAIRPSASFTSINTESSDLHPSVLSPPVTIQAALLTGGGDRPYALGLATALLSKGVGLDFIGSDNLDSPELRAQPDLQFLNLRGSQRRDVSLFTKVSRVLTYYARLLRYTAVATPNIFHILWDNKFPFFDRTLLMLYYKLLGKRIVVTAHNVNVGKRDSNDSLLNRLTLRAHYHLADHIFVHTDSMKNELARDFGVRVELITVIPIGVNNCVPETAVTPAQAKRRLGIKDNERTILFFGYIVPYKGLDFLIEAFRSVVAKNADYRLIIAGNPKPEAEKYWDDVRRMIRGHSLQQRLIERIEFIPDAETELYFKAADVLTLPYTYIYQSGILFLAYRFGLPVIATDVGALKDDIMVGRTGFLCRPRDPVDLARAIEIYFASDLFKNLDTRRQEIRDYANSRHSWEVVSDATRSVYANLLADSSNSGRFSPAARSRR